MNECSYKRKFFSNYIFIFIYIIIKISNIYWKIKYQNEYNVIKYILFLSVYDLINSNNII